MQDTTQDPAQDAYAAPSVSSWSLEAAQLARAAHEAYRALQIEAGTSIDLPWHLAAQSDRDELTAVVQETLDHGPVGEVLSLRLRLAQAIAAGLA